MNRRLFLKLLSLFPFLRSLFAPAPEVAIDTMPDRGDRRRQAIEAYAARLESGELEADIIRQFGSSLWTGFGIGEDPRLMPSEEYVRSRAKELGVTIAD